MTRLLLSGPAGSGKTQRVVDELRELVAAGPVERFVVVVPTYSRAEHLKRRLLRTGLDGMFDRGIGTFEQLAERRTSRRLSELAPMAVRDAILAEALADAAIAEFKDAARFPGFRRAALRLFKEVKGADPEPGAHAVEAAADRLVAAGESLPGSRGRKLAGLGRVLVLYQRRLDAAGLLDHEDLLRELLSRLRDTPPEPLQLLALDGFTDLTEVQERIVQTLVEHADRAVVTLLADGDRDTGPFAASSGLRRRLRTGSRLVEERLTSNLRAGGDLVRIERLVAGDDVAAGALDGTVRFVAGADPDDEADRVARTCLRFIADDGIPRSDVLVIVRSLQGDTAARVLDALAHHGVPARRIGSAPLASSPAARAALRILRLVAGCEEPDDALAALRGGDARGVAASEADALDRRAAVSGARGVGALLGLCDEPPLPTCAAWLTRLSEKRLTGVRRPPSELAAALLESIEPLLVLSYENDGTDDRSAANDAAALRAVGALVAETARGLRAAGRATTDAAEFVASVADAAADANFSPPDRRADVVNVVDADEARQWEARAVVVAGLRLGEWPAGAREDLFVSDRDRHEVGRSTHVRLASRLDEALRRERLLFYSAVTRARERLVLTTSTTDGKGDPALRSPFLELAMKLSPGAVLEGAERSPGDVRPAPGETFGTADLERTALAALTERFEPGTASEDRAKTGLALFAKLLAASPADGVLAESAKWFRGTEASLAVKGAARALLAKPRRRSASSLANFAQCAYRHFADKGLGLSELEAVADDGPNALLLGKIAHAVLQHAVPQPERAAALFDEVWEEEAGHFAPSLRLARDRTALRRIVLGRIAEWKTQPLVPGFRPAKFELAFGLPGAPAFALAAPAGPRGEAVELSGMIDRVDVDDRGRAVVVDYKYSSIARYSNLDEKLPEGLDLQLPIYALAAAKLLNREVVAAGYVTLRDANERWLRLASGAPGGTRADVTWEGAEGAARMTAVEARIREFDAQIRAGGIELNPRDPDRCGRGKCPFADLCRYEGEA
jgi:superfamily I DNA/RNA helicase/RecB family exonuclease